MTALSIPEKKFGWFGERVKSIGVNRERELYRQELKEELVSRWPGHSIRLQELVYESFETNEETGEPKFQKNDFVVFIDINDDIDWIHRSEPKVEVRQYISQAEAVGAKRAKHLPKEQRLELKRLVGQAIVSAISSDPETSLILTNRAEAFHTERTVEVSKIWKLDFALLYLLIFTILFCVSLCYISFFYQVTSVLIALYSGLLGAFCSISMRRHNDNWNAESGRYAHALEVLMRMIMGGIFGVLFSILARTSIIPQIFSHDATDYYSLFVFSFASGYSERLVLNIISSYIQPKNEQE